MAWMATNHEKRIDIQKLFPGARSVISVAHNYFSAQKHRPDKAKISRYAWGEDYHKIIKKKLKSALKEIQNFYPQIKGRICVDTAPFADKLWAEQSGVGWQGKHTNIITREFGSWVFLGALILDCDLESDPAATDFCGSCTACIEACPTNAIIEPYLLDATKCISYLTIEYWDEPIPDKLVSKMDNWVFGCDICQDVCPWNRFATPTDEERYHPKKENIAPEFDELINLNETGFNVRFKKSPVSRPGWENFIRNVRAAKTGKQK